MWRDVGLADWLLEIDDVTGADVAAVLAAIAADPVAARRLAGAARDRAATAMQAMVGMIG
jgi:hypothetical protein